MTSDVGRLRGPSGAQLAAACSAAFGMDTPFVVSRLDLPRQVTHRAIGAKIEPSP